MFRIIHDILYLRVERSLIGLKYNDTVYYYIKNMQEDIIGITDSNNNILCSYEYDSWGNIINIRDNDGNIITETSHIGAVNPFRYRSYYYDNETKLYYLNSRYYNPEWGRFINCDELIKAENNNYNLYTYCKNNPVRYVDYTGHNAAALNDIFQGLANTWNEAKEVIIGALTSGLTLNPYIMIAAGAVAGTYYLSQVDWSSRTGSNNAGKKEYTVYVLRNPSVKGKDGNYKVEYVGRTKNEAQRKSQHQSNPYKSQLIFDIKRRGLSYEEARGLEETLIIKYGTLNRGNYMNNQIHGISPMNPKYDRYMSAADALLSDETYVGGSKW